MPPSSTTRTQRKKRCITAEDLLKFQLLSDPQISPDGQQILFCKKQVGTKNNTITNLWLTTANSQSSAEKKASAEKNDSPQQFTAGEKDRHGRWSPDGSQVAFISERQKAIPQIYRISANGGEAVAITNFPEGTIRDFRWSPDGKMFAVAFRETDPEWTVAAKKEREETGASLPARVIDDSYYRLDGDGYCNAQRFQLHLVDIATGKHRVLYAKDRLGWFHFDWSPNSDELVVSTNSNKDPFRKFWKWDIVRVNVKTRKVQKLANLPDGPKANALWSPDGKSIAYTGQIGREYWGVSNTQLFICDTDGNNLRKMTCAADYCLSAMTLSDTADVDYNATIRWSPDSLNVFMNFGWEGETDIQSVSARGGMKIDKNNLPDIKLCKHKDVLLNHGKQFGKKNNAVSFHTSGRRTILLGNISNDGKRMALLVSDAVSLMEVAVGELSSPHKPTALKVRQQTTCNQPLFDQLNLSQPKPHWIESADGQPVQLWVMEPPKGAPSPTKTGRSKSKTHQQRPAILTVHGGPHCQYGEAFFHEFQLFAAAGYTVVFSNPRGSKGYGEEHCTAIRGHWGKDDWTDIQAVTEFMKNDPKIDATRIGICGGSYGGYITNWAIGHTNDFAAAVTDRCVSNLVSMAGSSDLPLVPGEYWDGNSWDDTEELWAQSPMKYLGNAKTPTLVVHSEGDLRCNIEQGEQVFAALKLRGIPTRFVRYPAITSHSMSRIGPPDLRRHRLQQYLDWWERYLT